MSGVTFHYDKNILIPKFESNSEKFKNLNKTRTFVYLFLSFDFQFQNGAHETSSEILNLKC